MSSKSAKAVVVKRKKRRSGGGFISEAYAKEYDAQQRLGGSFCAFLKVKGEVRFFIVANNKPETANFKNFFSIAIGASNSELGEAKDILNELRSEWNDIFSSQDFHPTVGLYFLSRYLKGIMEGFWFPKALAVEYMIFDPVSNVLHTVRLNGDYESHAVGEVENTSIVVGAYNVRLRRELQKGLQRCLDRSDISDKALQNLGLKLSKKYGLTTFTLRHSQVVRVPSSGTQTDDTSPVEID
ncbi:hypothetical protein HYW87_01880 [Candidatus Roizmanbacteria bacterium]|nr:hypothetical protein [Candidatus Roizmanbacteria bacterium]